MRQIGAAALGFLAGAVLVWTLTAPSSMSAVPAPAPEGEACSPEIEHAYEIMRFAQYSHVPWLRWTQTASAEAREKWGDDGEADFQRWWIREYATVLNALSADCLIATDYPPLTDLPGDWVEYPQRQGVASGAGVR